MEVPTPRRQIRAFRPLQQLSGLILVAISYHKAYVYYPLPHVVPLALQVPLFVLPTIQRLLCALKNAGELRGRVGTIREHEAFLVFFITSPHSP